jgi:hypothetical protein
LFITFSKVLSTWYPGEALLHPGHRGEGGGKGAFYVIEGQDEDWNAGIMGNGDRLIKKTILPIFQ